MINLKVNDYYKETYEAFYHIENILRISIHHYLISRYGSDYFNEKNFPEYIDRDVRSDTKINLVKRINNKYASKFKKNKNIHHIFYFDYSILLSFIKEFWDIHQLNNIFKTDCKNILKMLTPLMSFRNDIAHNRPYNKTISYKIVLASQKINANIQTKYINIYKQYIQTTINSENCLNEAREIILRIQKTLKKEEVIQISDLNDLFNYYNSLCLIYDNNNNNKVVKLFNEIKKNKNIENYNKFLNMRSEKFYPIKKDLENDILKIKDFIWGII